MGGPPVISIPSNFRETIDFKEDNKICILMISKNIIFFNNCIKTTIYNNAVYRIIYYIIIMNQSMVRCVFNIKSI